MSADVLYRIEALAKIFRVTVVSMGPLCKEEQRIANVDYLELPDIKGKLNWIKYLYACARLINRQQPDRVVLMHTLLAPMVWLLRKIPLALYWNVHPSQLFEPSPNPSLMQRLAQKAILAGGFFAAARRASLIMPVTKAHYHDLLHRGCKPERVRLFYMGVHEQYSCAASNPFRPAEENCLNLVYVVAVGQTRGYDMLLKGLALANRDRRVAQLSILGATGEEYRYCVKRALELDIHQDVFIFAHVSGDRIPVMLYGMDAGIFLWEERPWWQFNLPTKIFEYLAAGLPVLASDIYMHTQYIANGYNGIVFECSPTSLANAIGQLWAQRANLPRLKRNAAECGRQYLWRQIEPRFLLAMTNFDVTGWVAEQGRAGDSQMTIY
ncbi:glycosyltransferase family 4 protein [Paucimonas lemoignei]|nr:glycosyltransferase family 4 protein [Paucimonas lemoignei]